MMGSQEQLSKRLELQESSPKYDTCMLTPTMTTPYQDRHDRRMSMIASCDPGVFRP